MGSLVPVHPPLSAPPPAFECPEDTTEFFELTDDELRLPRTVSVRKNFSLHGRVNPELLYPFTFASNTLTLGFLWSTHTATPYTGIGIRHHPELSAEENRRGVEAYHYVLDEGEYVGFLNKTLVACADARHTAEDWRAGIRLLTGNCLVLLLRLKRMQQSPVYEHLGTFPLVSKHPGLRLLLCGLWEELWATAHQMASDASVRFNTAALVRASAAYYYYTEAARSKYADCRIVPDQTVENARQRLRCVLVGWIVERIPESRKLDASGRPQKWADIPWAVGPTQLSAGKYRAAVFLALGVVKNGRAAPPPAPQYADVFQKAVVQCETNLLTVHRAGMGVRSARTFSSPIAIDPVAMCLQIGADWAQDTATPLLGRVAHLKAHAARAVWAWSSDSAACPPGLEGPHEEGSRRYAGDGVGGRQ